MTSKFNKVPTQLESAVPAKMPVHVRSYGKWSGVVTKDTVTNGSCGPLILTFTPEESRTYQVDFGWNGTASCSSNVFDITDAGNRKSVPAERGYCP